MMKKLFVLLAVISFVTAAQAQFIVGGSFGFTSTSVDAGGSSESGSSFKIVPDVGYQLDDKISVGVQVGYSYGLCTFGSLSVADLKGAFSTLAGAAIDYMNKDTKLNGFTIAPYLRYNAVKLGRANLFLEGYVGYNNITVDSTPSVGDNYAGGDETNLNAFELGIRPGISFMVNDSFELMCRMGALGYMSAKEKESDVSISRFGLNTDTYNLLFGAAFHF